MKREMVASWSMMFVIGVGAAGCARDNVPYIDHPGEPTEVDVEETTDPTPDAMEPTVEEMPDETPVEDPVQVTTPALRCTSNVIAEDVYPRDLPGWDEFEFDVQIAPETRSFEIVGYNERGNGAMLDGMTEPDGNVVDMWVDPLYQKLLSSWYQTSEGSVAALTLPADPAQVGSLKTGMYTFRGLSQDAQFCYYVVEDTAPGTRLQLNMFFVGTSTLNAQNAALDEDWQQVEEVIANTFAAAGVTVDFEYVELPEAVREQNADPRSFDDLDAATRQVIDAVEPLPMRSIDVFLWDNFNGEPEQMHGMARGIPEAVGLHGEPGNGVVMQLMDLLGFEGVLGSAGEVVGNEEIGLSLSHELGHLLGLFHTSEFYTTAYDTLDDTPQCSDPNQMRGDCPDASNVMFPLGPMYGGGGLTEEQIAILTTHPSLIRE